LIKKQRTETNHLLLTELQIEGPRRSVMDSNNILNSVIAAAYVQAAETEMIARQIEARIIATGGRPLLRQYGKPIDAEAIRQNLTLVSQLNRHDPKLAKYLGVQASYQQQLELEQAKSKLLEQALSVATAALRERNNAEASNRYQHQLTGINPITSMYYI
jgi:MarR-like DNA-binding transcriptional regulator SgrR of sgrS sRNA